MVVVSAVGHSERFSSAAGGYYVVYLEFKGHESYIWADAVLMLIGADV